MNDDPRFRSPNNESNHLKNAYLQNMKKNELNQNNLDKKLRKTLLKQQQKDNY